MTKIKYNNFNFTENLIILFLLVFIVINALIQKDSIAATINAICGITYTFLAGKGRPNCYIFGVIGSGFYCYLCYLNSLWGNLFLYGLYYIPMQVLGYFRWNKHLKDDSEDIVKIELSKKGFLLTVLISLFGILIAWKVLQIFNDANPVLDSITTVLSIAGMYLTVKRAIQQWLFWALVNLLSLIIWLFALLNGARVYSTIIMWGAYFIMAIYFYIQWRKEIKNSKV